jgi:hypothetical protein
MAHKIPYCIILFLPRRSEIEPIGIDNSTVVNPVDDAKLPISETEAPRLLAKKGYNGIAEALAASIKKIVMQSAIIPRKLPFSVSDDINAQFTLR